jgi:hypothetical protein
MAGCLEADTRRSQTAGYPALVKTDDYRIQPED